MISFSSLQSAVQPTSVEVIRDRVMLKNSIEEVSAAGTMPDEEKGNIVCITHYINPHCFWYKPETAFLPYENKQGQFLKEFNAYCKRQFECPTRLSQYDCEKNKDQFKVGDFVACGEELDKWIRCVVEEMFVDLHQGVCYQLWAMDEGRPIKSAQKNLRPMPNAYTRHPAHAKRGALKGILPSETIYDYYEGINTVESRARWSPGIVAILRTILDDALCVRIVDHSIVPMKNDVVHFCEIFIKTHKDHSRSFPLLHLLHSACSDQFIVSPDEEFFKAVFAINTLYMVRYKNNEGIENTPSDDSFSSGPCEARGHYRTGSIEKSEIHKIAEWFSRTKKAIAEEQIKRRGQENA